jgi:di/tricarboxylate transporter
MLIGGDSPYLNLILLYVATIIATELITNTAAAVLMFPLAQVMSNQFDASILPFALVIMFAASASFLSPVGYQTNLMVQGPGGYKFTDYFKVGVGTQYSCWGDSCYFGSNGVALLLTIA